VQARRAAGSRTHERLARAGIPIFPVTASASGFVFVREEHLARAIETLARWGHQIREIST
jgi:hypothetical protein